ncbi:hypothetical protein ACFL4X_02545 [Gemmatimonadota bacterium]
MVYIERQRWSRPNGDPRETYYLGKTIKILDLQTGETKEPALRLDIPCNISWTGRDNKIIVRDLIKVQKYDPVTGVVTETNYQDVYISPAGKYCFRESVDDPCGLYLIDNQLEIPIVAAGTSTPTNLYSDFIAWGTIGGKTVIYTKYEYFGYIDCASGQLHEVTPPSPGINPVADLVGFRDGRPVWARISGDKAELYYY